MATSSTASILRRHGCPEPTSHFAALYVTVRINNLYALVWIMSRGITVSFDNPEKTIIRWNFWGRWTWDDWRISTNRMLELRASVSDMPCVPSIFDFKHGGSMPMGALSHGRATIELMAPQDYLVIAHASGFIRSLFEVFQMLNPSLSRKVYLVDTVKDARLLIAELDH